jgi:hypothetical protein
MFERFFLNDARLTGELLAEFALCDASDLQKLFGAAPRRPENARELYAKTTADTKNERRLSPAAETLAAEDRAVRGPTWSKPGDESDPNAGLQVANPPPTVWDSNGYRISPRLPLEFPRYNPQPRGSHWSR